VETSIARQLLGKYVPTGTNLHTTVEELSEAAFCVWSAPEVG
jgi:hypothetical protein